MGGPDRFRFRRYRWWFEVGGIESVIAQYMTSGGKEGRERCLLVRDARIVSAVTRKHAFLVEGESTALLGDTVLQSHYSLSCTYFAS